jgi:hypothetical protein
MSKLFPVMSIYHFDTMHNVSCTIFFPTFSGKLLPSSVYAKIEAIVKDEFGMFMHDQRTDMTSTPWLTLFDNKFDDRNHTMTCQTCGVLYQQKIRHKVDVFNVSYLFCYEHSSVSSVSLSE